MFQADLVKRVQSTVLLIATTATILGSTCSLPAATVLISKKSAWRYLDVGSNQGTEWKEPSFNDDEWLFGHGVLGYGDAVDGRPEPTVITPGPDEDDPAITYYFRRYFY